MSVFLFVLKGLALKNNVFSSVFFCLVPGRLVSYGARYHGRSQHE